MRKILLLIIVYLAFICIGLPNSLLGAAWPAMYEQVGSPLSFAGVISFAMAIGMVISSYLSERIILKIGQFPSIALGILILVLALAGFSLFGHGEILIFVGFFLGFGVGLDECAVNGYLVTHYSSAVMNWGHCLWSVGAALGPILMSHFIGERGSWKMGYLSSGGIELLILVLVLGTYPLWREPKELRLPAEGGGVGTDSSQANEKREAKKIGEIFSIPGVKQVVLSFFLYCSIENTIMIWAASYLVVVKQVDVATTAGRMSLFFIGMTVGRAIAGLIALKAGNKTLIRGGLLIIAATIPIILFAPDGPLLIAAYFMLGLGAAPVFPCLMHQTSENFRREDAQAIVGLQMASSFTGNAIMPLAFGFLADRLGYGIFPLLLFLTLVLLIITIESLNRAAKRGRENAIKKA